MYLCWLSQISSVSLSSVDIFFIGQPTQDVQVIRIGVYKYTKVINVLGINIERTLDLLNTLNIPNTMALEVLYKKLLLSRLHYFTKSCKYIIFIISGQCFILLEIISSLEKLFDVITSLTERDTVFGVQEEIL